MKNKKEEIKQLKTNKGITLVALVVTIIVLIILAGISINLILGDNGIITKAQEAKKAQEMAEIKEDIQFEIMAKQVSNKGKMTEDEFKAILEKKGTLSSEENILDRTLTTTEGEHQIKVSEIYNGKLTQEETIKPEEPEEPTTPEETTTYTRGQEVTIGTQTFYVLEDSDETEETVTLFAKYNLNTAATAQQANANHGNTSWAFSTELYWVTENTNVTPKFNLNEYEPVIEDTASAVYKAKKYVKTVFGEDTQAEGRLLKYEEATALQEAIETDETGKIEEMLWGQANKQADGNYLLYWLGSTSFSNAVYVVDGNEESVTFDVVGIYDSYGVRPVIEVYKSEI